MMMGGGCRLRQKQVMVMLYGQRIQAVHDHVRIFMPTKRATTMITSFTHNEILNRTTFWLLSCCFGYFFVLFWCFFLCNNSTATLCSSPFEISSQTGAGAILYYYLWMEHLFHIWTDPIGEYTPTIIHPHHVHVTWLWRAIDQYDRPFHPSTPCSRPQIHLFQVNEWTGVTLILN